MTRHLVSFGIRVGFFLLITTSLSPFVKPVSAVSLSYSGFMRNRSNVFYNLDLNRSAKPQNRIFADIRFRLDPVFHLSDWIDIKTSFDVIDDLYGGSPHTATTYSNPAQSADPYMLDTQNLLGGPQNTTHGSPYAYDTHVPLIIWGKGWKAEKRDEKIAITKVAEWLAK